MNTLKITFLSLLFALTGQVFGQVAINGDGSAPNGSAMLDITSTTKGILIPRMLESERLSLTPVDGLIVFQTDYVSVPNGLYYYDGINSVWSNVPSGIIPVASGGTNATTAFDARANLGLGGLAIQNSINNTNWSGQQLTVGNGGTGLVSAGIGWVITGGGGSSNFVAVNQLGVVHGGTGVATLTGYVKGSGTSAMTAAPTIPGNDVVATITTITGTTTLTTAHQVVLCNSSGTFTVTLPSASGNTGRQYTIKNIGAGTITIGATVDATSNPTLAQWALMTVVSNGFNWYKIGQ